MVQTMKLHLGSNDYQIFVVGNETTIGQLNMFTDQFYDEESGSTGDIISIRGLASWLITRNAYAGMAFRDATPMLVRLRKLPELLRFNFKMKRRHLYISGDDFLEALFLERPQQVAELFQVTEDEIRAGLRNTRFFEL